MKFSKMKILLLMMAVMLVLVACGGTDTNGDVDVDIDQGQGSEQTMSKLDEIKAAGKIVLGTSADYPPYEFHKEIDGKDTIVGFDIEIAKEIAKALGVELEIKDMDFDGLILALNADKVDFVLAGMTPDPERDVDFSKIYYRALQGVLINTENVDKFKTVEDLYGKRIGAQKGTIQEKIAESEIQDLDLKGLAKIPDLVLEVKHNKIDAVIMEKPVAEAYADRHDDLILMDLTFEDAEGGSAVAVKRGNPELIEEINKILDRLMEDGSVDRFVVEAIEMVD